MGDFYSFNEDVHRGLTMGIGDLMSSELGPSGFQFDSVPAKDKHDARDEQAQFLHGDVPPALPSDPYFCLESTVVIIRETLSPEHIGNGLLSLLREEVAASITKMRRIKFSVKAHVFIQGLQCEVKVRVYKQEFGYTVEFQRRSGDILAFRGLFRLASERLDSYSRAASEEQHAFAGVHESMVLQVPSAVGQPGTSKQELSIVPLLEMARGTSDVCMQSEVAEALAAYASDANFSSQLSTLDALDVCDKLSRVDHVSVAHPMRRLTAALAHVTESNVTLFAEGSDKCIFPAGGLESNFAPPPPPLMRL